MPADPLELEASLLRVLGHSARLRILAALAQGDTCVCELIPAIGLEQSNLSQHLKLLRDHGIVAARKEGTRVIYRLANDAVLPLVESARRAVQYRLARMVALTAARPQE